MYLAWREDNSVYLKPDAGSGNNPVWYKGSLPSGLFPSTGDQSTCLGPANVREAVDTIVDAQVSPTSTTKSPCVSFAEDPKGSFWYLDINDWGDSFAMGKCVSSEAGQYTLPFVYRKKERRVPIQCDSDELKGKCGQFTLDLASSAPGRRRQALATSRTAEEPNCFGFTRPPPKTTPAPPPTTPSPPSPTTPAPTTCDFCGEAELSCCGTGIHAFCYDSNYNECCPSAFYTEEFPVKVVCALGQGCQPGCSPHVSLTMWWRKIHPW